MKNNNVLFLRAVPLPGRTFRCRIWRIKFKVWTLQKKKPVEPTFYRLFCGGDEGDRTPYLLNAIQALSQVSYTPTGRALQSALL